MITGLSFCGEFITQEREAALLTAIRDDAAKANYTKASDTARSLVLRYGWNYKPSDQWAGDAATWLLNLEYEIHKTFGVGPFDSFTVNEYRPGDKIAPHIDSLDFGPVIAILSLSSAADMWFLKGDRIPVCMRLPARSLLLMTGEARYEWKHSIECVKEHRYSIVFRSRI